MIIVSNINIAVAIKRGGRPTRLLPHAKMLLVPRKFFLSLSLSAGQIMLWKCASFSSQSIHLGGVLEDFNKSIHKIHNLSCITLRLVLLVCWLGVYFFFWRKVTRGCQKGESFH